MEQTPCPDRFLDDCGGAFAMGCVGGSAWHGFKMGRNAPKGYKVRGFFDGVRTRGPVLGGQFAVWGSLFAAFDCSITHVRAAGAFTSGVLAIRGGLKPFLLNAMVGGFMLGVIEGLGHVLGQAFKPPENIQQEPLLKTSFGVEALAIKEKKKKSFQEKEIEKKRALVYNPELLDIDYRKETLLSDEIKYL